MLTGSSCRPATPRREPSQRRGALAWRAFIYAQAQLLVSRAVDSDATVKLVTGAVREMGAIQRWAGEALRRDAALIDHGRCTSASACWAPFVLVREGGAGR
jgi:hypothetical protein